MPRLDRMSNRNVESALPCKRNVLSGFVRREDSSNMEIHMRSETYTQLIALQKAGLQRICLQASRYVGISNQVIQPAL
jgi:hypothetical protein